MQYFTRKCVGSFLSKVRSDILERSVCDIEPKRRLQLAITHFETTNQLNYTSSEATN